MDACAIVSGQQMSVKSLFEETQIQQSLRQTTSSESFSLLQFTQRTNQFHKKRLKETGYFLCILQRILSLKTVVTL